MSIARESPARWSTHGVLRLRQLKLIKVASLRPLVNKEHNKIRLAYCSPLYRRWLNVLFQHRHSSSHHHPCGSYRKHVWTDAPNASLSSKLRPALEACVSLRRLILRDLRRAIPLHAPAVKTVQSSSRASFRLLLRPVRRRDSNCSILQPGLLAKNAAAQAGLTLFRAGFTRSVELLGLDHSVA